MAQRFHHLCRAAALHLHPLLGVHRGGPQRPRFAFSTASYHAAGWQVNPFCAKNVPSGSWAYAYTGSKGDWPDRPSSQRFQHMPQFELTLVTLAIRSLPHSL